MKILHWLTGRHSGTPAVRGEPRPTPATLAAAGVEDVPQEISAKLTQLGQAKYPDWFTAYESLERLGSAAVIPLLRALEGDNDLLRGRALDLLGKIGDERALAALQQAANISRTDFARIAKISGDTRRFDADGRRFEVPLTELWDEYRDNARKACDSIQQRLSMPVKRPLPAFSRILTDLHNANEGVRAAAAASLAQVDFTEPPAVEGFLGALEGRPLGHEGEALSYLVQVLADEAVRARILPLIKSNLGQSGTNEILYVVAESREPGVADAARIAGIQCRAELGDWRYPLSILRDGGRAREIRNAAATVLKRFDVPDVKTALEEYRNVAVTARG